ncbi:hypothetical protein SDC9_205885 [bioreactor metagenome]|uniref:Uncharacterized protein n=1 Tax=bioreactor metagenome TaxID=1076179 RepID=A0A645JCQ3_9ZZZZ
MKDCDITAVGEILDLFVIKFAEMGVDFLIGCPFGRSAPAELIQCEFIRLVFLQDFRPFGPCGQFTGHEPPDASLVDDLQEEVRVADAVRVV